MAVNLNAVSLWSDGAIEPSAPLIEGAVAGALYAHDSWQGPRYLFNSNLTGRYGMRITFPSALDFSGYDWRSFATLYSTSGGAKGMDTVANGGHRIIFVDGSGNYAGYNIYGMFDGYADNSPKDGFLTPWIESNYVFNISSSRTPDISSGAVNWSAITAIELTTKTIEPWNVDARIFRFCKKSAPVVTGTETLQSICGIVSAAAVSIRDPLQVQLAPLYFNGAAQSSINIRLGLTIGNGVTGTSVSGSSFAIGFENSFEFFPSIPSAGPWVQLGDDRRRPLKIIQSATDVLSLTDGSIASAGWWQWELSGSGVATCTRVQFWRFDGFRAAHGHYVDCAWNDADSAVEVTAATVISGGLIRGAKATGLKVLGAAGVYSNLDLSIDSLVGTYDIELGSGGAGTYELPNITVPAGRTLRIHNNSASNAIVVILPPGTLYSATTAGGSITVVSAGTKLTITDLPPGCDAVVLTAGTSTVLAQADELPGATFVFEYTGAPVVDIGIFKPGYKPRYLRTLQLAATDSAIPVSLEIDRSYLP